MKRLSLLLALSAGVSLDSHAQFGDFLKNVAADAARQAAATQLHKAVTGAVDSAVKSVTQPGATSAPAGEAAAQPAVAAALPPGCARSKGKALAIGARPEGYQPEALWPENTCPVYKESDLKFERAKAAKTAFVNASKVSCNDCEGGYWPDAWGWRSLVKDSRGGNYADEFAKMLVALQQGESLAWKGNRFEGVVTASGAHPIGAMPCRQFHYVLNEKGRQVAQYDGLLCEYTGAYSSKAAWHDMI